MSFVGGAVMLQPTLLRTLLARAGYVGNSVQFDEMALNDIGCY